MRCLCMRSSFVYCNVGEADCGRVGAGQKVKLHIFCAACEVTFPVFALDPPGDQALILV